MSDATIINPATYYRPPAAAKCLNVSVRWLQYDRSTKRQIPYSKLGNQVVYCGADLLYALKTSRMGGEG